jgi:hypothetical protein
VSLLGGFFQSKRALRCRLPHIASFVAVENFLAPGAKLSDIRSNPSPLRRSPSLNLGMSRPSQRNARINPPCDGPLHLSCSTLDIAADALGGEPIRGERR